MKCPKCKDKVSQVIKTIYFDFKGKTIKVNNVPVFLCKTCKTEILPNAVNLRISRKLNNWLKKQDIYEVDYEIMKKEDDDEIMMTFDLF